MVFDEEDGRLCVKMPDGRHLHAAGCDAEGCVLEGLESIDVGGFGVGEPDGGCIIYEGLDEGFEGDDDGLLLLPPIGASKRTEDVEASCGALDD